MRLVEIKPKKNFQLFVRYEDDTSGEVNLAGFVGKGVFSAWEKPGAFENVWLAEAGHPGKITIKSKIQPRTTNQELRTTKVMT